MELVETARYRSLGLTQQAIDGLAVLGDLLRDSSANVTGITEPLDIEHRHFLDSLSLLALPYVVHARTAVDVGSGAGLPALVLALALPGLEVVALEATAKKCRFVAAAVARLGLVNARVVCSRAEEVSARVPPEGLRESFDVAVVRAVGPLAVIAELAVPLVRPGGAFVAMKGPLSDQERLQGESALAILGGGQLDAVRVEPFPGATERWLYMSAKQTRTPPRYPRRVGVAAKKPLGGTLASSDRLSPCEGVDRAP